MTDHSPIKPGVGVVRVAIGVSSFTLCCSSPHHDSRHIRHALKPKGLPNEVDVI